MRAAADEIPRANRFQRRLHRRHELAVSVGIADFDIEYYIGCHVRFPEKFLEVLTIQSWSCPK